MLWTWQGYDFDPLHDAVDRARSEYLIQPVSCPDIRRAYAELDELLALPPDGAHQFAWCLTEEQF